MSQEERRGRKQDERNGKERRVCEIMRGEEMRRGHVRRLGKKGEKRSRERKGDKRKVEEERKCDKEERKRVKD